MVGKILLGRAYEYLIKQFADNAGAKAGEFFTPPEVVDTLMRILELRPGDTIDAVGAEFQSLYADPDELLKHARVVGLDEIQENEYNLNIPRYVDAFEPEPRIEVADALKALREAETSVQAAEQELSRLLEGLGYTMGIPGAP